MPVNVDIAEDSQEALACIFRLCKLNSHVGYMVESFFR